MSTKRGTGLQLMEWISVKDQLPNEGKLVRIYTTHKDQATAYINNNEFTAVVEGVDGYDCAPRSYPILGGDRIFDIWGFVTHWIPLADPPEPNKELEETK
jgi:hypothetical protein